MRHSIQTRLTLAFIALAIGPLLLFGLVLAGQSFSVQQQQALNLERQVARRVSIDVSTFIQSLTNNLQVIVQVRGLQGMSPDRQQNILSEMLAYQKVFEELTLLDSTGKEQIHVSRLHVITSADLADRASAPEFTIPSASGKIYYSPVRFDPATREPLMTIAIPLLNQRTGRSDGVLIADSRVKKIWDLIAELDLQEGESVYILDAQSRVIAHRDPSVVLRGTLFTTPVQDSVSTGLRGDQVVIAVDRIQLGDQVLAVVAERSWFTALRLAINTVVMIGALMVGSAALASVLGFRTVRQIVRPLEALVVAAQAIKRGDLSHSVPVTSRDEIGVLAETFNSMTGQLRETLEGLRKHMAELRLAGEERLALERKLLEAQKLESLGVLAGGIAHDFNNLLAAILGNAELALLDLPENSPAHASISQIEMAARRAAGLTQQMLAYSGRGHFVVDRHDLNAIISETAELLRTTLPQQIELQLALAPQPPTILADATQIRQALMNLVANAAEAIGEHTGTITLSTRAWYIDQAYIGRAKLTSELVEGAYVELEIADTGHGMDTATQAKIFEPFFTTKFTGRGLGLAAVLGIVRGHRGALTVQSLPGHGATFHVLLPLAAEEGSQWNQTSLPLKRVHPSSVVLIVDDAEHVRAVASRMLQQAGFMTLLASDGAAGIELYRARAGQIDCVLLDLTLPRLSGEQTFRELYRIDSNVRIVLMSEYDEHETAERFADLGVRGFLHKPFSIESLRAAVGQALDRASDMSL
jgi:signal transduction histidine kinase/ActR/RegA family two-component response regulator